MSINGIRTVARLELVQRRRASRWPIVLGVWFLVIGAVTVLTWFAVNDSDVRSGRSLYDVTTFFVLGMGMLVVPSLTATSINGDREGGVLASLQTTLLTPADLVLGKLLASWVVSLVFLAITLPFLVWAWVAGGIGIGQVAVSLLVLALVLAAVCAVGLMFSTLAARPVTSAVLTYLTTAALVIGTVIVFFLSFFLVSSPGTVRYYGLPDEARTSAPTAADCRHLTRQEDIVHTERIWWLLPLNPFVVVADAAPSSLSDDPYGSTFTPMRWISEGARAARVGSGYERNECWPATDGSALPVEVEGDPVWPYGLAFLLLAGAGATAVAIRRVRTPIGRLPNGTRIA